MIALEQGSAVLRAVSRLLWLSFEIVRAALAAVVPLKTRAAKAKYLQQICRRALHVFAVHATFRGAIPTRGLLVANHLSYLDILLLASVAPCVFVSKGEVRGWPVFGWFARLTGTIFVNRQRRRDAVRASDEMRAALRDGALVVLFPEGTSSDGTTVLPFKSSLLESAITEQVPITVAAIRFDLIDGDAGTEVCYWGEHTLVPHLVNLLSKEKVISRVLFAEVTNPAADRKALAHELHARVSALHEQLQATALPHEASHVPQICSNPTARNARAPGLLENIEMAR